MRFGIARKRYKAEEIIGMLQEAKVALAQGETVGMFAAVSAYGTRAYTAGAENMAA